MDPSTGRSQQEPPPRSRTPASRDIMFCHECHKEWYRDEHGIACPQCRSDFTEIIEEDNDPRDHDMFDHGHYDDDNEPMPSLEETPPHLHHLHHPHPWQQDDPEEGDISNLEWRQVGPGRFAVRTTMYRTVSPGAGGPIGGFASLLNNLIGGGRASGRQQNQGNQSGEGQNTPDANNRSGSGPTSGGHRFTYTAGARLYPRDPDHPGPHLAPVDELNNVLVGLMAEFGEPPGEDHHHHHFHDHDHDHDHDHGHGLPFNPIMGLLAQMMGPGGRQAGSLVYSQEVLDRIVSQLMEQNAGSNAPGPASQNDINALPRKPVSEEMLGTEGRAECSICMDEVKLEEEVTELPCKHWFHHPCVAAWLGEHDTCPHCREGITKPSTNENLQSSLSSAAAATPEPSRTMPGAFSVSREGTSEDPYVVIHSSAQTSTQSNSQRGFADDRNSRSGLVERLR